MLVNHADPHPLLRYLDPMMCQGNRIQPFLFPNFSQLVLRAVLQLTLHTRSAMMAWFPCDTPSGNFGSSDMERWNNRHLNYASSPFPYGLYPYRVAGSNMLPADPDCVAESNGSFISQGSVTQNPATTPTTMALNNFFAHKPWEYPPELVMAMQSERSSTANREVQVHNQEPQASRGTCKSE